MPASKLKPITAILDAPPMRAPLRRFIDWMAAYTLAPPGEVMAMALRINALTPDPPPTGWRRAVPPPARLTEAARPRAGRAGGTASRAPPPTSPGSPKTSAGVVRGDGRCRAAGGRRSCRPTACSPAPTPPIPAQTCRPSRHTPPRDLRQAVAARAFSVTLLDGVTGSGKTEVYLEAVAECLAAGRQALVLLPEIALSSQWLERFERRFGIAPGGVALRPRRRAPAA